MAPRDTYEQTGVAVDTPDVEPADATAAQDDRPSWLPDKFESPEKFAESYTELERRLAQEAQARADAEAYAEAMAEQLAVASAQPEPAASGADVNPLVERWERAWEEGDAREAMALTTFIAAQMADNRVQQALQQVQQTNQPDPAYAEMFAYTADQQVKAGFDAKYGEGSWDEFKTKVGDFLAHNTHWLEGAESPTDAARRISQAAEYLKATELLAGASSDNPQPVVVNGRQLKLQAQTLTGLGARVKASQDAADSLVERMKAIRGPYGYSTS